MSNYEMQGRLMSEIRSIADVEINKMNAFFMCGSPTDMPNENLIRACENYLSAKEKNAVTDELANSLVSALEKATELRPGLLQTGTVRSTIADIQNVLANKETLYMNA